ncbi:hypothetical protein CXF72_18665 [Psychromonas sp. MB-3u-54]|uniref:hypothetical protein n=1 Tax=Psychromonas sp. MB-3u-54 TaxID=2058319 RepID=UPI000C32E759|nr:hypothetical protein [Psychromonas sp. MB-3u-54]PKH01061.1 hypothetical protein CXF72_18665 [Psychromonas sp. MB-3u-54]
MSRGETFALHEIQVKDIKLGQNPASLFYPPKTFIFKRGGDWDSDTREIEKHPLYISYMQRIINNMEWKDTPYYKKALSLTADGGTFRGGDYNRDEIHIFFDKCDDLIEEIKKNGYKSNRRLFSEGKIKKICLLSQEVSVNISRDKKIILNDGWNRFIIAKLLGIETIPVRILITHKSNI